MQYGSPRSLTLGILPLFPPPRSLVALPLNRIGDSNLASYRTLAPRFLPKCACPACQSLQELGEPFIADLLSSPAYTPKFHGQERLNRSDVLALVALHNLYHWAHRVTYLRS